MTRHQQLPMVGYVLDQITETYHDTPDEPPSFQYIDHGPGRVGVWRWTCWACGHVTEHTTATVCREDARTHLNTSH